MGVYIDMKMPEKQVCIILNPNGLVEVLDANNVLLEEYQAVSVPPHRRLIDARYIRDAIIQKWMDKAGDSHMYKCGMEDAYEVIRNAPTIIPAEEGE